MIITITNEPQQIDPPCKLGFTASSRLLYVVGTAGVDGDTVWEPLEPFTAVTVPIQVKTMMLEPVEVDRMVTE